MDSATDSYQETLRRRREELIAALTQRPPSDELVTELRALAQPPLDFRHHARTVATYTLTEDEIDNIAALDFIGTISLAVLSASVGAILTFLLSANTNSSYAVTVLGVLTVTTAYAAVVLFWSFRHNHMRKTRITQRPIVSAVESEGHRGAKRQPETEKPCEETSNGPTQS